MKINAPKEKYIFIELNKNDMKKLSLDYASMDYSDEETRKAIFSVLESAKLSLGQDFELSDTKRVEALPREDGGCLLFFTIGEKLRRYRLLKKPCEMMYSFDGIDGLIDFSSSLEKSERQELDSSLYLSGSDYFLRLSGKLRSSLIMRLREYAYPIKSDKIPSDIRCIIAENALEILCGGVSK